MLGQLEALDSVFVSGQLTEALECRQVPDASRIIPRSRNQGTVWAVQIEAGNNPVVSVKCVHAGSRVPGFIPVLQLQCYMVIKKQMDVVRYRISGERLCRQKR